VRAEIICATSDYLKPVSLYNALDQRIGIDENGTQTWTLYDSGNPIMDFNSSGTLTMRYLWGPTGVVARQTSGGTVSWYLADALGTVRDLINNSGAIIDHVDFSAFGTVLDESSPSSGDRMMGFAGLERDSVTSLNLAVEREENPGTGRWDTQDPTGFGGADSNLYRYASNLPGQLADPLGLQDGQPKDRTAHKTTFNGNPPTGSVNYQNPNQGPGTFRPTVCEAEINPVNGEGTGTLRPGEPHPVVGAPPPGKKPVVPVVDPVKRPVDGGDPLRPFAPGPAMPLPGGPPAKWKPYRPPAGTPKDGTGFWLVYFNTPEPDRPKLLQWRNGGGMGTGGGLFDF
jgi:RHS repeat-associated protein